ncbi:DUF2220 family protein [Lysobacter sp. GX 14042]|uniref:Wadjet anti-phage system protein JetD domain-containing protein n=1 Tax=Lysobacter sp. GX 14042 TaxID=2907155 RepID=UPI001F1889BD|nr:Wadjet anti-phage system protein JetD domain-containing protein [Lysobacter sp. GX 14042]MCE7031470.1 DUF2220 family protein [Lysobacter sp. GX 14042]
MDSPASSPATRLLERLLARGENARARDDTRAVRLTGRSCPEYAGLDSLAEFERFHGQLADAGRTGAIKVERERGRDAFHAVVLLDLDRLGAHLGRRLRGDRVAEARALLARWLSTYPVLEEVLERWEQGKPVRGNGPDAAPALRDALQTVDSRRAGNYAERILRRESVRLFGDSKRLERLTPWLDLVTTGELTPSGLHDEDIRGSLGLRREPQPMLVAGRGEVELEDTRLPLCRPYLGLPVDAVRGIASDARYLLTIENLASFHDAARVLAATGSPGLLVYTAGMPSPAWRALYRRILAGLPATAAVYHWGDIDEGGFRIAAALAVDVRQQERTLQPWLMASASIPEPMRTETVSSAALARMSYWAAAAGWESIAMQLHKHPFRMEQEALDPTLP